MRAIVMVGVLSAACVSSEQVVCGTEGKVCPTDYACTTYGCASVEQLAACNDIVAEQPCTIERGTGICLEGACFVAVCGNNVTEPTEACDDGNAANADGCNSKCSSTEVCGNKLVELDEQCDSDEPACNPTTCAFRRCGDDHLDPEIGELCDDGNLVGGDGCNPACDSVETCGNDTLDYFAGETCEDSNLRSRDGCSTACRIEVGVWQQAVQDVKPAPRLQMGLTFDNARGVWVMFGGLAVVGSATEVSDETWETDGTTWTERLLETSSPRRVGQAMAYDPIRRRVVMFGGTAIYGGVPVGGTWELDGARWVQVQTATSPAPRSGATFAFDPKRKRLVLFGGTALVNNALVSMNDTWTYDGITWTQLATTTPPATRRDAAMAYDATAGHMVLYGGDGDAGQLADTWFLDGTTWTPNAATIGMRSYAAMSYDSAAGRVVMFGGRSGGTNYADTYELVGSSWTVRSTSNTPSGRVGHALVGNPVTGTLLLFGGIDSSVLDETLVLNGSTFTLVEPQPTPIGGGSMAMAYDSRRGRTVLLSHAASGDVPVTWAFDGTTWTIVTTTGDPGFHRYHAMTYDAERDRAVVFGGNGASSNYTDTFELAGSTWTTISTTTKPPGRLYTTMAYDPIRKRIVMYGGLGEGQSNLLGDTWEYYASDWHAVSPAMSPPNRHQSALAFDPSRGKFVLFGGQATSGASNDTWEYDGINWTLVATTARPPARHHHSMVYDAGRGHLVVFGGLDDAGVALADLWELDGTTWRELPMTGAYPAPPSRFGHTMSYDTAHRELVVFAGQASNGLPRSDTWTFAYVTESSIEACTSNRDLDGDGKAGCADDDCWGVCAPLCSPLSLASTCPTSAGRCGDGTCDPVESCRSCAADCGVGTQQCPVRCGDGHCDSAESQSTCPGDCTP